MATTLEILAPYLPYGIEVENEIGERAELIGLNRANMKQERRELAEIWPTGKGHWTVAKCEEITPLLYSFEDLRISLPDGSIPAVEIAKISLGHPYGGTIEVEQDSRYQVGKRSFKRSGIVIKCEFSDIGIVRVIICDNWKVILESEDSRTDPADDYVAIINYLHSKQFAVGLTADQYIRKGA